MNIKAAAISVLTIGVGLAGLYFMDEAQKQKSAADDLRALTAAKPKPQPNT